MAPVVHVTVDASALAFPGPECSDEEAQRYVDVLVGWAWLSKQGWVGVSLSENVSPVLQSSGTYPEHELLELFLKKSSVSHYTVRDLSSMISGLLYLTPTLEDRHGIKEILLDDKELEPYIELLDGDHDLGRELGRCVFMIAVLCSYCSNSIGGHFVAIKQDKGGRLRVHGTIHGIDYTNSELDGTVPIPVTVDSEIDTCDTLSLMLDRVDEASILTKAVDDVGVEVAIRVALVRRGVQDDASMSWQSVKMPEIGPRFREEVQRCCADQGKSLSGKILRAVVGANEQPAFRKSHALRESAGAGASQQRRGSWKVQRWTIDKEFRLHYLVGPNGRIRLEKVGYHREVDVPES